MVQKFIPFATANLKVAAAAVFTHPSMYFVAFFMCLVQVRICIGIVYVDVTNFVLFDVSLLYRLCGLLDG